MRDDHCRKIVQKQAYDVLSHKYGILIVIGVLIFITLTSFYFGETVVEWSNEKYAQVFNSYSDNIAGRSYRERLCSPLPIDVVYTWVNGTDPKLLNQLRTLKLNIEEELNITSDSKCVFTNCLVTNMVILDPVLPKEMTLLKLSLVYKVFVQAEKMFTVSLDTDENANYTVIVFKEDTNMTEVLSRPILVHEINTTVRRGYITTDWTVHNSIMLKDTAIMAGFPPQYTAEQIQTKLPEKIAKGITKFTMHEDEGLAVIQISKKEDFEALVNIENFTLEGKKPTFSAANLVWDLRDFRKDSDISASRFEDNEELRYSLRSLERFAPWVRHVYIITNGQIPYWLNMESSRLTIVTHQEIFTNTTHLPTFSSPAIEANIHKIPGLSQKFIYMNDDVMFGKDVWPDDFYTYSDGYKVYLTWPVPNCNEGCPSSWIKDGYCDKACNNTECEWDGGDCHGSNVQAGAGHWSGGVGWYNDQKEHCNKGCADSWLADRYCDTTCNVKPCGFDVGDCGTSKYDQLIGYKLETSVTEYIVPKGEVIVYFNMTTLMTDKGSVESAEYEKSSVVKAIAVANKFKVITMVFNKGHNATKLHIHLKGHYANVTQKFQYNFTVMVDTTQENKTLEVLQTVDKVNKTANVTVEKEIELPVVYEVAEELIQVKPKPVDQKALPEHVNLTNIDLPEFIKIQYEALVKEKNEGDITEKGFRIEQMTLWLKYQEYLRYPPKNDTSFTKPVVRKLLSFVEVPILQMNQEDKVPVYRQNDYSYKTLEDMLKSGRQYTDEGHFPWEEKNVFGKFEKIRRKEALQKQYTEDVYIPRRRLLDTFGDSLRHVNKIYNREFGFTARKVPGHMPHFVDRSVMYELHEKFPEEWDITSSHKVRSSDDMQFAFSYFYYLMGVKRNVTAEEIFDEMDTDKSRSLSDREIRTLAASLYDLPLDLKTLSGLENILKNCSEYLPDDKKIERPPPTDVETYYDKDMPQATRTLFLNCDEMVELIQSKFKSRQKHKFVTLEDHEIAFKMIKSNISTVVGQLDDLRKNPKKFICLNDNIEHNKPDAQTVKAILQDYYESVLPIQSQFELPREYRNRFLHVDDLRQWKRLRDWLKFFTHIALVILVLFTIASYFGDKIEALQKKFRRQRPSSDEGKLMTV
ncbi:N-acetylglucosamine-1-phosphotransferase subunits alpha/beta-like [Mytilus galloprovincialis]|uniref:N-acetylglucosamine-1-phosphotransferase subunits alpha/beta-like n=1 Tax=Mytilus galloprovincialis TaxID=29158 RepID=UPI003F7C9FB2